MNEAWLKRIPILFCILAVITGSVQGRSRPANDNPAQHLQSELHGRVQEWISAGQMARPDGFTYAVDIGQLLTYAALNGDHNLYVLLRDFVVRNLISDDPSDPYTRGFVVWRIRNGTSPEASGTTEALRVAQGFWLGSQLFGESADRDRALMVLRGYARHAFVDQGIWLIRNYFNFQTRSFATNSFLVDYDPDFVRDVAETLNDPELRTVANESQALVRRTVTLSGLLHEIIQPEVLTLFPDLDIAIFSPNDVVQLANSCTVAERSVKEASTVAQEVLQFGLQRRFQLKSYYYGSSGRTASDRGPGPGTYASLVRLAVKLENRQAVNTFVNPLTMEIESFLAAPYEPRLYVASEFLLALQMLGSM